MLFVERALLSVTRPAFNMPSRAYPATMQGEWVTARTRTYLSPSGAGQRARRKWWPRGPTTIYNGRTQNELDHIVVKTNIQPTSSADYLKVVLGECRHRKLKGCPSKQTWKNTKLFSVFETLTWTEDTSVDVTYGTGCSVGVALLSLDEAFRLSRLTCSRQSLPLSCHRVDSITVRCYPLFWRRKLLPYFWDLFNYVFICLGTVSTNSLSHTVAHV